MIIDKGQATKAENKQGLSLFLAQLSFQPKRNTAATVSLFEIPGCFADVLWLKAKVNSSLFCKEKEQTYVWNPLLLQKPLDFSRGFTHAALHIASNNHKSQI
jgi:hypothetical protein